MKGAVRLVVVVTAVLAGAAAAAGAERMDCDRLFEEVVRSRRAPQVTINAADMTVRVETRAGFCIEPITAWTARKLPPGLEPAEPRPGEPAAEQLAPRRRPAPAAAPPTASVPMPPPVAPPPPPPEPAKPAEPFETHPLFKPQPPPPPPPEPARPAESVPPPRQPTYASACTREVAGLWRETGIVSGGITYRLYQVYTIDTDGDDRIDNVGFRFRAPGKPDINVRYFEPAGRTAGRDLPALRLPDEAVIKELCFGQAIFEEKVEAAPPPEEAAGPLKVPDLAAEMKARQAGIAPASAAPAADDPGWKWAVAAGAAFLIAIFAGIAWTLARRRRAAAYERLADGPSDDEEESGSGGEDDEESGSPRGKKGDWL
jgi:hypothetical protein